MNELDRLLHTLEKSLEKNGDMTITLSHLINLIKTAQKYQEADDLRGELYGIAGDIL